MPSDLRPRQPSLAYQHGGSQQRRTFIRILAFTIIASILIFFSPQIHQYTSDPSTIPTSPQSFKQTLSSLWSGKKDWSETVEKIRNLQVRLQEDWPRTGFATYRPFTIEALDRLATCMTDGTCGKDETTVIMLGSFHFGNSQTGHTSGEDIWAGSLVDILQGHNYTLLYTYEPLESLLVYKALGDLVPLVIMETAGVSQCIELGKMTIQEAETYKQKIEGLETLREGEQLGCAKRVGFEEGIPLHKIRALHFWLGARHPIPAYTLSPENYTGWWGDSGNYYLGYHLEHCRHVESAQPHLPRAFVLGKRPAYFQEPKYAWPVDAIEKMTKEIGGGFEFVGGAGKKGVDEMPMKGITNLGSMKKDEWNAEVAKSSVMFGVGNPPLSPSPYDAWCLGVPFINPILRIDKKDPENRIKWLTQHEGTKDFDPPYVYHVMKDDMEGLKNALKAAMENPFPPFIPERMKKESVEKRLLHLIEHDWETAVGEMIKNGTVEGYADLEKNRYVKNGLLL